MQIDQFGMAPKYSNAMIKSISLRDHSVDSNAFRDSMSASTLLLPGTVCAWAALIHTFGLAEH